MIRFPTSRSFTCPLPPFFLAALALAAVILPPLLFLAMDVSFIKVNVELRDVGMVRRERAPYDGV